MNINGFDPKPQPNEKHVFWGVMSNIPNGIPNQCLIDPKWQTQYLYFCLNRSQMVNSDQVLGFSLALLILS